MKKKNVSSLSDHKVKKGKVVTPWNDTLGDKLQLNSWSNERLPEYIWLGLILSTYGRTNGLNKAGSILSDISKLKQSIYHPKLSLIFNLPEDIQRKVFDIIIKHIKPSTLSPLTLVFRSHNEKTFYEYFCDHNKSSEQHIEMLSKAIRTYMPAQSNEATDLRFLAMSLQIFSGKLYLAESMEHIATVFQEYAYTDHSDEKMRSYRPTIRSMEGVEFEDYDNSKFINYFWSELGMVTECKPMCIHFEEEVANNDEYINDSEKVLDYLLVTNKGLSLSDHKFEVLLGKVTYALKIFKEIVNCNLSNKILGRHALRSIIEIYIIVKYLLKMESEKPDIWREYKYYGISKYKLILLKVREITSPESLHFEPKLLDLLVNEKLWEEFIDVDLRYFDQLGIREKSIAVEEKELYDISYDYDSSYAHGLWGAIRESSMLSCDNPAHRYHNVPDIYSDQNLISVKPDCIKILNKCFSILNDVYTIPKWYLNKYGIK